MKKFNEISKEELQSIVNVSNSLSDVLRKLNRPTNHGNFRTLKKYCNLHQIDLDEILYNVEKYRIIGNENGKLYELFEILISGSTYANVASLKKRLYKEGLKKPICEKCGQNEWWHEEKITLILDHINGIHNDNRIENLRILCPNCNATLPTNGGKNIRCKKIRNDEMKTLTKIKSIVRINGVPEKLLDARKLIRTTERPSFDILLNEIFNLGYSKVGKKYGVSDNTIRKWVKYYEKYEE